MKNLENGEKNQESRNKFRDELRALRDSLVPKKINEGKERNKVDKEVNSKLDNLWNKIERGITFFEGSNETKSSLESLADDVKKSGGKIKKIGKGKDFDKENVRSPEVVGAIGESARKLANDIKNWKNQKNPIAKFFLMLSDKILNTEK